MAKKHLFGLSLMVWLISSSFAPIKTLKGTWIYQGGVYNGKAEGAPTEYSMERIYTVKGFTAYVFEKGSAPEKYEAGTYVLKGDTCFETTTFSSQPSRLVGKKIAYIFTIQNKQVVFKATLPSGMTVEEYWKKKQ